jgi:hypothetical protein
MNSQSKISSCPFKVGDILRPNPEEFDEDIYNLTVKVVKVYDSGSIQVIWSDSVRPMTYRYKPTDFLLAEEHIIDKILLKYGED